MAVRLLPFFRVHWAEEFRAGDIIYARSFGQHFVVLNRLDDAIELFEKRSGIYSDRPHLPMAELYAHVLLESRWSD